MSDFIQVAKVTDLPDPGKMLVEVDDRLVVLFRVRGQFYAIDDVCTHDGGPLSEGALDPKACTIACPRHGADPPPRTGASHATIYPYGPFPAGDGKTIMLGLQNEREWSTFCARVLMRPDLASDPRYASNSRRSAARDELRRIIVEALGQLTATEVLRRLDEARIANARVNDMHDVWSHPQLAARQRWRDVDSPAGPIPALLPPGTDDEAMPQWGPVPALGAHTDRILTQLGYSPQRITELRAEGAI